MIELATILVLVLVGPGFLLLGLLNLKSRAWRDGVPAAELLLDRALGAEPPPRNAWDRRFGLFNAAMLILFGLFFSLVLVAILYSQFVPE
jgi:hypothetical protein